MQPEISRASYLSEEKPARDISGTGSNGLKECVLLQFFMILTSVLFPFNDRKYTFVFIMVREESEIDQS